jgi:Zn-dependent protease with chaperone function
VPDGAGGFFLFLFESFVARALLGSVVAVLLVELLLRRNVVRSLIGRRLLLVVPFVVAGVLALASANRGFLPNVWIDTDRFVGAGVLMDVLGDVQHVGGNIDLLVAGYLTVVGVLASRRVAGALRAHLMRRESPLASPQIRHRALYLAVQAGTTPPEVRLRAGCAGGAFTTGVRRPWIALDPALARSLDAAELDALLAHEIAHIRRRDPLLTMVTGLCRDLTFFLPGIHLAIYWLRREQEEAADDLAATCTGRPGALASTILKVWEAQTGRVRLSNACAAVAPVALRWPAAFGFRRAPHVQQPHVVVRVQRLISPLHALTHRPRRRDVGLPLTVLTLAVTAGLLVPAWATHALHNDGVLLQFYSTPSQVGTESPAFATFRATAPTGVRARTSPVAVPAGDDPLCPCVESAAQLRAGVPASTGGPPSHLVWSNDGRDAWELQRLHEQARLRVNRELITFRGGQRGVGFFTVSRNPTER